MTHPLMNQLVAHLQGLATDPPKVYRPGGQPVTLPSLTTRRPNEPLMPPDPEAHRALLEAALGRPLPSTSFKPEPSLATLGRAKAKGTPFEYVSPHLPLSYLREKAGFIDLRGLPTMIGRTPADDTAAPLTAHLANWLRGR